MAYIVQLALRSLPKTDENITLVGGNMPERRAVDKQLMRGTWYLSIHMLQLAEESVPSCVFRE